MKVYYDSSILGKGRGLPGLGQRVNWQFKYKGQNYYIPYIYRFFKGIVFDIITILDEVELESFYKKYEHIEEKMTSLERLCAEQEHPFQSIDIKEIWINQEQLRDGYSYSSTMSLPWEEQSHEIISIGNTYSHILKNVSFFACQRFCIPYPKTSSKIKNIFRFSPMTKVRKLKIKTYPLQKFFPLDIHFEISEDKNSKEISFNHPKTKVKHTLYFQDGKPVEFPMGIGGHPNIIYGTQLFYEIQPALSKEDSLQFNNSIQYEEPLNEIDGGFKPTMATSIGIIGGADGPTAVYISSNKAKNNIPIGIHGLPLHSCLSVLSFEKQNTPQFIIEGMNIKDYDSSEYNFSI